MHLYYMETPLKPLKLTSENNRLVGIDFTDKVLDPMAPQPVLESAAEQLTEYFQGKRKVFDLPVTMKGTSFQISVWNALLEIPYGKTVSYSDIALRINRPQAIRAVGMANHCNSLAIIIPCHRIIGKNGDLTGYAGGIELKKFLLELERRI